MDGWLAAPPSRSCGPHYGPVVRGRPVPTLIRELLVRGGSALDRTAASREDPGALAGSAAVRVPLYPLVVNRGMGGAAGHPPCCKMYH